ncbi:DUF72 domain-containing protein [Rhodospirillaceae bacterium SYSU D60014]|uniref:DUF72 domain-containing protein n=1 Tax=Virgifigura deserti TaxID=2268457 RepID=UPI000E660A38
MAIAGSSPRPIEQSGGIRVGCAGWAVPKSSAEHFPAQGSHLERYACRFDAVEINSSFYRPHRPATYARWAATVPEQFRFSVKMPKEITHLRRLKNVEEPLDRFLAEAGALSGKLAVILAQFPPSLRFDARVVRTFLAAVRTRFTHALVCEPRHASWFDGHADDLLAEFQAARVAADPALVSAAGKPGGWNGFVYYRLHGTPQMYYSAYAAETLDALADRLIAEAQRRVPVWCIFDNTALGAATENALSLGERLQRAAMLSP